MAPSPLTALLGSAGALWEGGERQGQMAAGTMLPAVAGADLRAWSLSPGTWERTACGQGRG